MVSRSRSLSVFSYGPAQSGKTHALVGEDWESSIKTQVKNLKLELDGEVRLPRDEDHGVIVRAI